MTNERIRRINDIIDNRESESSILDYKQTINFAVDKVDFIKDMIAFGNCLSTQEKCILYGIKESPSKYEIIGIGDDLFGDESQFHQLIQNHIEPQLEIVFQFVQREGKRLLGLFILSNLDEQPYMVKKPLSFNNCTIDAGDSWIRIGSIKRKMIRSDYETIYSTKVLPIEVQLREKYFSIINQNPGQLEITIKNHSTIDRIFSHVFLLIQDEEGKDLVSAKMYNFISERHNEIDYNDFDFYLTVPKQSEIIGVGEFPFNTSQAAIVGLSKYGDSEINYRFVLIFVYGENQEQRFVFDDCTVFGKGAILRKIVGVDDTD